jgi:hypothetical protein
MSVMMAGTVIESILAIIAIAVIAGGGTIAVDYLVLRQIRQLGPRNGSQGEQE